MSFLPVCRADMDQRGWDNLDFLFISGDAYVDHPSFGSALLTRLLESLGYRVGIIARPSVENSQSLLIMGRPLFGVFVSSGVVDSMVNNYTSAGKKRSEDRYAPGGEGGQRPDRALIKYCNMVRAQMGDIPLVIGGVEASLRRFAHYDVWSDKVRRSVLQDSQADLLIYGMGESPITTVARYLAQGSSVRSINSIRGTCVLLKPEDLPKSAGAFVEANGDFQLTADQVEQRLNQSRGRHAQKQKSGSERGILRGLLPEDQDYVQLPSFEQCQQDKMAYAVAFAKQYMEQDPGKGKTLIQRHGNKYLMQNPPVQPMPEQMIDQVYDLPFERRAHPDYDKAGGVPAIEEVRFSVNSHRGCFGGCNFCAITFHQGRIIQKRSQESVLAEVSSITQMPDYKGYIHDIGGPTANFHEPACEKQEQGSVCKHRQCMFPKPCPSLKADQSSYLELLRKARQIKGVKKIFVRSGVRYDYALMDPDRSFINELCRYHVSGQLKVAPEHVSANALKAMGKPPAFIYEQFKELYEEINHQNQMKQYLVPYLISGHPGCNLQDAIELALYIKNNKVMPEQVQDFYPTPGTVSTTMYYTGLDPFTLEKIHVPDRQEKRLQRALLQFGKPENRKPVVQALQIAGRMDLIGFAPECLLRPLVQNTRRPAARGGKAQKSDYAKSHGSKTAPNNNSRFRHKDSSRETGQINESRRSSVKHNENKPGLGRSKRKNLNYKKG